MLLSKSTNSSTAPGCPVPCPRARARARQAPRPSPDCCSAELVAKLSCDVYFLGDAPSKSSSELLLASSSITKRRSGGRYLLVILPTDGIGVGEVDFCGACDQEQAKVRNLPFGRFRGPLCPVAVPHFPHCTMSIWQPRCRGASAVLLQ